MLVKLVVAFYFLDKGKTVYRVGVHCSKRGCH